MPDFISRNALIEDLKWLKSAVNEYSKNEVQDFIDRVETFPKADAVEVVLCKECKKRYNPKECPMCVRVYGEQHDFTQSDGYCDRGERRNDGETG